MGAVWHKSSKETAMASGCCSYNWESKNGKDWFWAWEVITGITMLVLELRRKTCGGSSDWLQTETNWGWGWRLMLEQGAWAGDRGGGAVSGSSVCISIYSHQACRKPENLEPCHFPAASNCQTNLLLLMVSTSGWLCWVRPPNQYPVSSAVIAWRRVQEQTHKV